VGGTSPKFRSRTGLHTVAALLKGEARTLQGMCHHNNVKGLHEKTFRLVAAFRGTTASFGRSESAIISFRSHIISYLECRIIQGVAVPIFPEYSSKAVDDPWPCSCHRAFCDLRIATQNSEVLVADATHNAYKAHQSMKCATALTAIVASHAGLGKLLN